MRWLAWASVRGRLALAALALASLVVVVPALAVGGREGNPPPTPTGQEHSNASCLMCHADPDFSGVFENGETLSLYVDPAMYYRSIHSDAGLECLACHTDQRDYPHRDTRQVTCTTCHRSLEGDENTVYQPLTSLELPYPDRRSFTLKANEGCRTCHEENFEESVDSAHARVLAGGNPDAPVCVDCHGSHDITPPDQPRARISETCASCHLSVYTTYKTSVHGEALSEQSNPDVPTCVDCHGVHNISGPRDPNFRNNSILICGNCHADEERMAKYGISTAVFETYLDDFHGRTVNFFRRERENYPSNKATCFDCHGIHNIRRSEDPLSTVYPDNLQSTCQQCHPDAGITFPQAWLSHYIPSWESTPGLYAVNLAYQVMVPGVVGFFLVYIALDARKRFDIRLRKPRRSAAAEEGLITLDEGEDEDESE